MRKVTQQIVAAFLRGDKKRIGNSHTDGDALYLHGNMIANKVEGGILITNAGWSSNTTKERLNGIPGVRIYQRDYQWYLNDKPWDGSWAKI